MRMRSLLLAVATAACATSAHAIHVNDVAFLANGGRPDDVQGSALNVFDALRNASMTSAFQTVGRVGDCTGVWLADDANVHWVLTSARCVANTTQLEHAADHLYFTTADGRTIAGGPGSKSFIHPNRIHRPGGIDEAGSDIAVLRLRSIEGFRPQPPVLHDRDDEIGATIAFVGHGPVGIDGMPVPAWPVSGPRRIWGESVVDHTAEDMHALVAGYAAGSATQWARGASDDAGTPWWALRDGTWRLFALTSTGDTSQTTGVRIAPYVDWIRGLVTYSSVSNEVRRDQGGAHFTQDTIEYVSADVGTRMHFQIAPGQAVPLSHQYERQGWTFVRVPVTDAWSGREDVMVVRASRLNGCSEVAIHDDRSCRPGDASKLKLYHIPADHFLPHGQWRGSVTFDVLEGSEKRSQITVELDHASQPYWVRPMLERYSMFIGAISPFTDVKDVYFTVPTQPGASGPTNGHLSTAPGYALITVHAREAVTQSTVPITLRAIRSTDCGELAINNGLACETSRVEVWFEASDNPGLAPGRYRGMVELLGRNWNRFAAPFVLPMHIPVDINMLLPSFLPWAPRTAALTAP